MSALAITMAGLAYIIIGMIVVESARIWFGMWLLEIRLSTVALWPLILFAALFGKNHES